MMKKSASKKTAPQPSLSKISSARRFWLLKSEPECYSIDDFARDKVTYWDGVRNYQARNMLRDQMQVGDGALFYHSSTDPLAVVGIAEIVRTGYPDHTQFDAKADHYDATSPVGDPRWFMVDVKLVEKLAKPVTRGELLEVPELQNMVLLQRGSRLSVQPVTPDEWRIILQLSGAKTAE